MTIDFDPETGVYRWVSAHPIHTFELDALSNVWRCECGHAMTDERMPQPGDEIRERRVVSRVYDDGTISTDRTTHVEHAECPETENT